LDNWQSTELTKTNIAFESSRFSGVHRTTDGLQKDSLVVMDTLNELSYDIERKDLKTIALAGRFTLQEFWDGCGNNNCHSNRHQRL